MGKNKKINLKTWLQPRLRRLSFQWPARNEAKRLARVERGKYRCSICNNSFGPKEIVLDHIDPVIPVNIPLEHLSIDIYITNLFCDHNKFQTLCIEHHNEKSQIENQLRDEWITKEKYIIYKTTNKINKKFYIGIHKCIDYDDGYLGSGKLLKYALNKYGRDNFEREILFCFDNITDAMAKEKELVNSDFLKNEDVYNLITGGVYCPNSESKNKKRITCHETGEVFESITDAAKWLGLADGSNISRVLNNPNDHVRYFHFFETDKYDPNIKVTFPRNENYKKLVHLNTKTTYPSMKECCKILNLPYKSVRNAACIKEDFGGFQYKEHYFIDEELYDPSEPIIINTYKILCVELGLEFDNYTEAAKYIKHENPIHGGIFIGKVVRNETNKAYGYTWKKIIKTIKF